MIKKIEVTFTDEDGNTHSAFLQLTNAIDPIDPPIDPDPDPEIPPEEGGDPDSIQIKPGNWDFKVGENQTFRAILLDDTGLETSWPAGTEFLWEPRSHRNDAVSVSEAGWTPKDTVVVTAIHGGTSYVVASTRGPISLIAKPGSKANVVDEDGNTIPVPDPDPGPVIPPPPVIPPTGKNVTPSDLLPILGPVQLLSNDISEFNAYNAGIEKGMKQLLSTYNSNTYAWRNGSAQQNNPHYGVLRRVVYWCLRHGKPLDPSKVPELAAAIDVIGQAAKAHFESSLNQQMYRTTHAVDFVLFVWFKQNAPAGSNDEYLKTCAEAYIWSNAAQATSWAQAVRITDMDHNYYSGGREFAQEIELWRCANVLNSPYKTHPNSSASFFNFGDWKGNIQENIKLGGLLLDKIAARFTGDDPKKMPMIDGEWRVATHARSYVDPKDTSLGTKVNTPYPVAVFMSWMVIHQLLAAERTLGISGGYALAKRMAPSLMRYYRPATKSFPYLSHFIGAPTGGDNSSPDLNMFAPASLIRLEKDSSLNGGIAMALDLVRGTASAGGFGWRWKQDQELASVNEGPCTSALLAGLS